MWTTFSKTQATQPQKTLVPGVFAAPTTITVPNAVGGIEIVPEDLINTTRFLNLSIENKADTNGDPISIYLGVGTVPTAVLYSVEMLSGQQEYSLMITGQKITAIAEAGQTIKVNIQLANAISRNL